jgi:hypothetical protein
MEVTFKIDIPKEHFTFLREVADKAECAITDVVKEIIRQRLEKEKEVLGH